MRTERSTTPRSPHTRTPGLSFRCRASFRYDAAHRGCRTFPSAPRLSLSLSLSLSPPPTPAPPPTHQHTYTPSRSCSHPPLSLSLSRSFSAQEGPRHRSDRRAAVRCSRCAQRSQCSQLSLLFESGVGTECNVYRGWTSSHGKSLQGPCSPARSHTRPISRRLALSSVLSAAVFLSPTPVDKLCFPLQLKFTSLCIVAWCAWMSCPLPVSTPRVYYIDAGLPSNPTIQSNLIRRFLRG